MKRSVSQILTILVIVALVLGGATYWYRSHASDVHEEKAAKTEVPDHHVRDTETSLSSQHDPIEFPQEMWNPAGIEIAEVTASPLDAWVVLTGKITLNEDKLSHLYPLVEGRVDDVRVRFGQHVHRGATLVVVQSREVGQLMLSLFQDRLKLDFAQTRNEWIQQVCRNTLALIEMMRGGASVAEIEKALKDRPMGDYREQLMTAYLVKLNLE